MYRDVEFSRIEQLTAPETIVGNLRRATIAIAITSMKAVSNYQMSGGIISLPDKADGSVLTAVDMESAEQATAKAKELAPLVPILDEELGLSLDRTDNFHLFLNDPIDGTRPFKAEAPTPTVISSLYDSGFSKLIGVTIGEPATGRLWHSDGLKTWQTWVDVNDGVVSDDVRECVVWDGQFDENGMVLIENFREFARKNPKTGSDRLILSNDNCQALFGRLQGQINIQNYGSNGLHHALVANGGGGVAGAITTSMGGEWDVAGVLAVVSAGGVAEAFHVNDDRTLESVDPLNPFEYDMVISANNERTLSYLRQNLLSSVDG